MTLRTTKNAAPTSDEVEPRSGATSQEAAAAAMKAISQGVLIAGADRRIISSNAAFLKISGFTEAEIVGKPCSFVQGPLTDPETVAAIRAHSIAGTEFAGEILNYRKDGSTFWNELTIAPVRDAQGQVTHYIGITRDITLRKQLESQLLQSRKLESLASLSGGLAHQFNNLLGIIVGNLDFLQDHLISDFRASQRVQSALRATERGADITRRMLKFSRLKTRSAATEASHHDVNPLIEDAVELLRGTLGSAYTLHAEFASGELRVQTAAVELESVILDLGFNARDAMPTGGHIRLITTRVELAANNPLRLAAGPYARLQFTDTGEGMSAEHQARAFDPFFTTRKPGGSGLGLAMAYSFAQRWKGNISLQSEVGKGTSFELLLPLIVDSANTPV